MQPLRWHFPAAVALVVIGSLRIASTYQVFNHTIDEPDNLAAGLEYLSTGRYLYHDENPPLARVFAAFGPFLAGERYHPGPLAYREGLRVLGSGAHYDRTLALARAGILPFFWIASLAVYFWGLRAGGPPAALGATALFTSLPPVLALSGIANTDMALCAAVPAALLASLRWAERPCRARSILLGVLIALACLSKFTAIPFLACAWILMLATELALAWPARRWLTDEIRNRRRAIFLTLAAAALAIWAAYAFSFARVGFLHLRLPAPRFFTGLEAVWAHQQRGHPAYLLGERSPTGFRYYFPVVLVLKLPLAFCALTIAGAWAALRRKPRRGALLPLAFAIGIVLAAMASNVNIGVRYVLPALAGFAVVAGTAIARARAAAARIAVGVLLVWHVASGALQHPDYLAYTNEIAFRHPERFVADSDLDWGQDMKRLAAFLTSQGVRRLAFTPFNPTYPLPVEVTASDPGAPAPGWNAVSVTLWKVFGNPEWADRVPLQRRIGGGIFVWFQEPGGASR